VATDTTYGNGEFLHWLADRSITPYMRTRDSIHRKVPDSAGNLYGVTVSGGDHGLDNGTIFELSPLSNGKWPLRCYGPSQPAGS